MNIIAAVFGVCYIHVCICLSFVYLLFTKYLLKALCTIYDHSVNKINPAPDLTELRTQPNNNKWLTIKWISKVGLGFQKCSSNSAEVWVTRKANWSHLSSTSCGVTTLKSIPISRKSSLCSQCDVYGTTRLEAAFRSVDLCLGRIMEEGKMIEKPEWQPLNRPRSVPAQWRHRPLTKRLAVCPCESWLPCHHRLALCPMKLIAWHSGSNYLQAPICFHREECLSVWAETFLYPFWS